MITDEQCFAMLRRCRWPEGPRCVYCGSESITVHTRFRRTPRRRYLCLDCRHTFTDLTATIFAGSNLALRKWFAALSLVAANASTMESARALGVKWETARRVSRLLALEVGRAGLVRDLLRALEQAGGAGLCR